MIEKGYNSEITWCNSIPPLEELNKEYFFREYVWVVLNSGMLNQVAEKIFTRFWTNLDFNTIKHPHKHNSIKEVFTNLDTYFEDFKKSNNKLDFLESLPHIGKITKYHLARNLGLGYAKPDRHLVKIASVFLFDNVQAFCNKIAEKTGEKVGVVDIVLWRFANILPNYLEILHQLQLNNISKKYRFKKKIEVEDK